MAQHEMKLGQALFFQKNLQIFIFIVTLGLQ